MSRAVRASPRPYGRRGRTAGGGPLACCHRRRPIKRAVSHSRCDCRESWRAARLGGAAASSSLSTVSKDLTTGARIVTGAPRGARCRREAAGRARAAHGPRILVRGQEGGRCAAGRGQLADRLDDGLVETGEGGQVLTALALEPGHHRRVLVHPGLPLVEAPRLEDLG